MRNDPRRNTEALGNDINGIGISAPAAQSASDGRAWSKEFSGKGAPGLLDRGAAESNQIPDSGLPQLLPTTNHVPAHGGAGPYRTAHAAPEDFFVIFRGEPMAGADAAKILRGQNITGFEVLRDV